MDIKQALLDPRFRDNLPLEIKPEVVKFLDNPAYACNVPLYRKILKDCKQNLADYFPEKIVQEEEKEIEKLSENNFMVINCHVTELQNYLKKLPKGRKQIAIARYEDQLTVIVNELDVLF